MKLNQEKQKQQEELFEEARKKLLAEKVLSSTKFISDSPLKKQIVETYNKLDIELSKIAESKTKEYIQENISRLCNNSFEKIKEVYKILLFPETVIQDYYKTLSLENLKKEFHRMVKFIHPDKNSHPNSADAFHKIYKLYSESLEKHLR